MTPNAAVVAASVAALLALVHDVAGAAVEGVAAAPRPGVASLAAVGVRKVVSAKRGDEVHSEVSQAQSKLADIDRELRNTSALVAANSKELRVYTSLEKEKEEAAHEEEKNVSELRVRSEKLRREAEVASEIAKEKGDAASHAEHSLESSEGKEKELEEASREVHKLVNRTGAELMALQERVKSLQEWRQVLTKAGTGAGETAATRGMAAQLASDTSSPHGLPASATVLPHTGNTIVDPEMVAKLLEENARLKDEKHKLELQLAAKKVAQERDRLHQKLKNKLALADRKLLRGPAKAVRLQSAH